MDALTLIGQMMALAAVCYPACVVRLWGRSYHPWREAAQDAMVACFYGIYAGTVVGGAFILPCWFIYGVLAECLGQAPSKNVVELAWAPWIAFALAVCCHYWKRSKEEFPDSKLFGAPMAPLGDPIEMLRAAEEKAVRKMSAEEATWYYDRLRSERADWLESQGVSAASAEWLWEVRSGEYEQIRLRQKPWKRSEYRKPWSKEGKQ